MGNAITGKMRLNMARTRTSLVVAALALATTGMQADAVLTYTASSDLRSVMESVFGAENIVANEYDDGAGTVVLKNEVKSIEDQAFMWCCPLTSIRLPDGVERIGENAFAGCTSLQSVAIQTDVRQIGASAFEDCTALTSIALPYGVETLGGYTFSGCTALASVTLPDDLPQIGESAFSGCASLTTIAIPKNVKEIGESAFSGCASLTSVAMHDGLKEIGDFAFDGCASLASVAIPGSVERVGASAFGGCASLTRIVLPEGVKKVEPFAFDGCTSLASIAIPKSVTEIGDYAFDGGGAGVARHVNFLGVTAPEAGFCAFSDDHSAYSVTVPADYRGGDYCGFAQYDKKWQVLVDDGLWATLYVRGMAQVDGGCAAYYVKSASCGELELKKVNGFVSNSAVLIKAKAPGLYEFSGTYISSQCNKPLLVGAADDMTIRNTNPMKVHYVLHKREGDTVPRFWKVESEGAKVCSGEAYLEVPLSKEAYFNVVDGEPVLGGSMTAVAEVPAAASEAGGPAYMLSGIRARGGGLVVKDGRKIIVR